MNLDATCLLSGDDDSNRVRIITEDGVSCFLSSIQILAPVMELIFRIPAADSLIMIVRLETS